MRYEDYIDGHRRRWQEFERRLERLERQPRGVSHRELEALSVDYRRVLHDHAFSQSHFEGTWADRHLRQLAVRATHLLQWREGRRGGGIARFFLEDLPRGFRSLSGELTVCAALFLLSAVVGAVLSALDPAVGTAFIGRESVAGLERGEIWTDGIRDTGASSSALIAANNIRVAITAWGGGILLGLGAFYILFLNGFLLGAVVTLTFHFTMQQALLEFISAHGPLELSIIVVSAAAGVHVGRTIVSQTASPLGERLPAAARRSATVMLGCLPWLLLLGFVEGFVSPAPDVAHSTKIATGLLLASLFFLSVLVPGRRAETANA